MGGYWNFSPHMALLGKRVKAPLLTYDGENDHHKIENIPPNGEVVVAEGDELQHALAREQHDEHQVDPVEDVGHLLTLVIRLHHHSDHVEADEDHDADVKDLFGYKIKDHPLKFVLKQTAHTKHTHTYVKKVSPTYLVPTQ